MIWEGSPEDDTGIPGAMASYQNDRVLRTPVDGFIQTHVEIGGRVQKGQLIAEVEGHKILAPIDGILRGLLHDGLVVHEGLKVGDIDPRNDVQSVTMVSEKSSQSVGVYLKLCLRIPISAIVYGTDPCLAS